MAKEINAVKHECTFIAHEMSICKACPQCCAKLNKIIFNYAEGMQLYHANNILHIIAQEERFLSFYSRQFLAESNRRNPRTLRFNCVSPTHPNGVNQDNNPFLLRMLAVVSDFHILNTFLVALSQSYTRKGFDKVSPPPVYLPISREGIILVI